MQSNYRDFNPALDGLTAFDELTEQQIALEENELQELEAGLLATDFSSPEEHERMLQEFNSIAGQLRQLHREAKREHLN